MQFKLQDSCLTHKYLFFYRIRESSISQELGYLKKESTNSNLLNTCKSSIPSPTPIYLTGI